MVAPNQLQKLRQAGEPLASRTQDQTAAVLNPIAKAVNATPIMGAAPPAWIQLELAAGFATLASAGVPGFTCAVHRDALGYTWFKLGANTTAGAAALSTVATLPAGYRPNESIGLSAFVFGTGASCPIFILPTGVVQNVVALAAFASIVGYVSFLAEQ